MKNLFYSGLLLLALALGASTANAAPQNNANSEGATPRLDISFVFQRGGLASSQYAIWIENKDGQFIRTLFVTQFTPRKGYLYRPDALPLWVARADRPAMTDAEVDAVSGATPRKGALTYHWDGKDGQGKTVAAGTYRFFVEGTLYWKSRVLFSGEFEWGGASEADIPVTTEYFNHSTKNADMITDLKASYIQ